MVTLGWTSAIVVFAGGLDGTNELELAAKSFVFAGMAELFGGVAGENELDPVPFEALDATKEPGEEVTALELSGCLNSSCEFGRESDGTYVGTFGVAGCNVF